MNPKQFLTFGGIVLIVVAILGFFGIIGPTPAQSIFGDMWWFDNAENWAHLVLGVIGLIAAFAFPASLQKPLVLLLGIVAVLIGLYSGFVEEMLLGANLENPADTALHLLVGAWALLSSLKKEGQMMPQSGMTM